MTSGQSSQTTLGEMLLNRGNVYDGNLVQYFRTIFHKAKNVNLPYHNFRHVMHVTWLCYDACLFYSDRLSKREMRNLLIAAMFHDFDHRGVAGDDSKNIELAVQGLAKHVLPDDKPFLKDISSLIEITQFPYSESSSKLALCAQIIREADLSQSLNVVWMQQVIFGLAAEWNKPPIDVLKGQIEFLKNVKILTDWGKKTWPQETIDGKIEECARLLEILENG